MPKVAGKLPGGQAKQVPATGAARTEYGQYGPSAGTGATVAIVDLHRTFEVRSWSFPVPTWFTALDVSRCFPSPNPLVLCGSQANSKPYWVPTICFWLGPRFPD